MKFFALVFALIALPAWAAEDLSFDPRPGAAVPADIAFREARLGDWYGGAPIVLVLGYGACRHLCGTTLNGVAQALRDSGLAAGRDYTALFASIDPRDESQPPETRAGWHFLTGARAAARAAAAVGFRYRLDPASGEYAHPAGFVVLTPQGRVAQYFEGVRFDAQALRGTLAAARGGEVQSPLERLVFLCFHDEAAGRNTPAVLAAVRIAMLALLAALGVLAWRRLR